MAIKLSKSMKPVYDFVFQVLLGAALFTIILFVAVGLAFLVQTIEALKIAPEWLIDGLHWIEFGLFWVDAVCFGLFLVAEALMFARALWSRWSDHE